MARRNTIEQLIKTLDDASQADASAQPARKTDHYVTRRGSLLQELTEGTVKHQVQRLVDPAECILWPGNPRSQELLDYEACKDLIEAIQAEGRQQIPAIVRPLKDGSARYEVICGVRRHFAISWLRANGFTEFKFLVEERTLTDEEAFRLADAENRGRRDISDYEKARTYLAALDRYYGGSQSTMAKRLGVSDATLSRLLSLARLPEEIVAAIGDYRQITNNAIRPLLPLLNNPPSKKAMLARAVEIAETQETRRSQGQAWLTAAVVVKSLIEACRPKRAAAKVSEVRSSSGVLLAKITPGRGGAARIEVTTGQGVAPEERIETVLEAVRQLLSAQK